MAQHTRLDTLAAILDVGLVPVFHHPDAETAKNIVDACAEGGARVIEFTNRGDLAWRVFCDLIEHARARHPGLILGTGSVLDAPTAGLYINCGSNFIVGPCLNPEAARVCNRRKVPYMPGCGSVTEISAAEELGVEIVKVFPGGQVGGPGFIKAVLGPLPWSRLMPTGGVEPTEKSIGAWIEAGAAALGMGSKLVKKDLVQGRKWAELAGSVAGGIDLVRRARGG